MHAKRHKGMWTDVSGMQSQRHCGDAADARMRQMRDSWRCRRWYTRWGRRAGHAAERCDAHPIRGYTHEPLLNVARAW